MLNEKHVDLVVQGLNNVIRRGEERRVESVTIQDLNVRDVEGRDIRIRRNKLYTRYDYRERENYIYYYI